MDFVEPSSPSDALLVISKAVLEYDSSHERSDLYSIHLPSIHFPLGDDPGSRLQSHSYKQLTSCIRRYRDGVGFFFP